MRKHYEVAIQALQSLDFYAEHYASSEPYQRHFQEVVSMLRTRAENAKGTDPFGAKFLKAFADALVAANAPG